MSVLPDQGDLYPEVTAAGSLGAALEAAATEQGLSVPAKPSALEPRHLVTVPSTLAHRKDLMVRGSAWARTWSVYGHESARGMLLLNGETPELAPLARLAHAWRTGTPLAGITEAAPFTRLTGRFEVPDNEPTRLTESEWQFLLAEAAREGRTDWLALVEAAAAEPCFRRLYPHHTTWFLEFATTTRPAAPHGGLVALGLAEGTGITVVTEWGGEPLGDFTTAPEAVAAAAGHLPANLGPVTYAPRDPDSSFPSRG